MCRCMYKLLSVISLWTPQHFVDVLSVSLVLCGVIWNKLVRFAIILGSCTNNLCASIGINPRPNFCCVCVWNYLGCNVEYHWALLLLRFTASMSLYKTVSNKTISFIATQILFLNVTKCGSETCLPNGNLTGEDNKATWRCWNCICIAL